jgi:Na+/proline symporter
VAGVAAASFSTFDSIGSTVPSLLVRDVYARVFVGDREDAHYLRISRYLTPLVILGSFAFVPLLLEERGMLLVFLDWVSAFVVPLLAVYLIGTFTRAHRSSAAWGLAVGIAYGTLKLAAPSILPPSMVNNYATSIWSLLLTAGAMAAVTALRGREPAGDPLHLERTGWLRETQLAVGRLEVTPSRNAALPAILGLAVVLAGALLSFVVFW